jgi:hypothetical protein
MMEEVERKALIARLTRPNTDVIAVYQSLLKVQQADQAVVCAAVSIDAYVLRYAPDSCKRDPDVVLTAIKNSGQALSYASVILRNNIPFNVRAMQKNGKALEFVWDVFKKNSEIVEAACKENINALWHASSTLQKNSLKARLKAWGKIRRNTELLCQGVTASQVKNPHGFFAQLPEQTGRFFLKNIVAYAADKVLTGKQAEQAADEAVSKALR